jgi:hypothetical protein
LDKHLIFVGFFWRKTLYSESVRPSWLDIICLNFGLREFSVLEKRKKNKSASSVLSIVFFFEWPIGFVFSCGLWGFFVLKLGLCFLSSWVYSILRCCLCVLEPVFFLGKVSRIVKFGGFKYARSFQYSRLSILRKPCKNLGFI